MAQLLLHKVVQKSLFVRNFFIVSCIALVVQVFSSTAPFTWRGNVLRLKDITQVRMDTLPLKFDMMEKEYPLLPEAMAALPGHRQIVFSNEMKFRELMSDSQKLYSNEFIRCNVDESGGIERIGLLCRIIEKKSLKNGQALYVIESSKSIQIGSMAIKPGKSYLTSTHAQEVSHEYVTEAGIDQNEEASRALFEKLKRFLRISKLMVKYEIINTDEDVDNICLTPELVALRPEQEDLTKISPADMTERHRKFSYAVGNYLSRQYPMTHDILDCSISRRLIALAAILDLLVAAQSMMIGKDTVAQAKLNGKGEPMTDMILDFNDTILINRLTYEDLSPRSVIENFVLDNIEFGDIDDGEFQLVNNEIDDGTMQ